MADTTRHFDSIATAFRARVPKRWQRLYLANILLLTLINGIPVAMDSSRDLLPLISGSLLIGTLTGGTITAVQQWFGLSAKDSQSLPARIVTVAGLGLGLRTSHVGTLWRVLHRATLAAFTAVAAGVSIAVSFTLVSSLTTPEGFLFIFREEFIEMAPGTRRLFLGVVSLEALVTLLTYTIAAQGSARDRDVRTYLSRVAAMLVLVPAATTVNILVVATVLPLFLGDPLAPLWAFTRATSAYLFLAAPTTLVALVFALSWDRIAARLGTTRYLLAASVVIASTPVAALIYHGTPLTALRTAQPQEVATYLLIFTLPAVALLAAAAYWEGNVGLSRRQAATAVAVVFLLASTPLSVGAVTDPGPYADGEVGPYPVEGAAVGEFVPQSESELACGNETASDLASHANQSTLDDVQIHPNELKLEVAPVVDDGRDNDAEVQFRWIIRVVHPTINDTELADEHSEIEIYNAAAEDDAYQSWRGLTWDYGLDNGNESVRHLLLVAENMEFVDIGAVVHKNGFAEDAYTTRVCLPEEDA